MQTWYRAVCDEHKECCTVMVTNPHRTHLYLMDRCQEIQEWLSKHYGCNLRLVHQDEDLDKLWDEYTVAERVWEGRPQYFEMKDKPK